ncbi:hypothetical protein EMIHUDRAFT_236665 [Emiliania huxleyi CCMP1516]|uniref:FAD-binding domain-containing protein n=2 Tax=Emiliania huxleyi TaxID=2903 RepID=A0A0D3JSZ3_EMIH1|nr:hypothetical protein EMIHUDRAFT_236665 [Emiliania huxleyi CCMP1516]EOD26628.1 hypothetical protein EMIHUDRAFT_236665 [Emiliania huxleyi CCMP1516]|eukprot:XP_005779057.1 hypothetical protein EMIHUDRAFT_236665 [Emiliania huxleyi CCMP1516]
MLHGDNRYRCVPSIASSTSTSLSLAVVRVAFLSYSNSVGVVLDAASHRHVALVGDASNGMYSLFGQGCASALLQADMLAEALATPGDQSLESMLSSYSEASVKEGHAIAELNLITHALRQPFPIRQLALWQAKGISKRLAEEVAYNEILRKHRLAIWLSKFFWRGLRTSAQT